jgi:uncharacterized protein YidB (DUF937 family)
VFTAFCVGAKRYSARMSIIDNIDMDTVKKVAGQLKDLLGGGGAHTMIEKLNEAGHGDVTKSWVGTGVNLPISADQIASVLGNDTVKSMAAKVGIPTDKLAGALAQLLPKAVDSMTPDGKLPAKDAAAPAPDVAKIIKDMEAATAMLPKK